ncbi:hypothetical protein C8J57DRAFT_485213 [Mycena rebaudengoi]|nr:hypothetical protein C8J57DRAFT_485213 [Mycena rebaudengoi]
MECPRDVATVPLSVLAHIVSISRAPAQSLGPTTSLSAGSSTGRVCSTRFHVARLLPFPPYGWIPNRLADHGPSNFLPPLSVPPLLRNQIPRCPEFRLLLFGAEFGAAQKIPFINARTFHLVRAKLSRRLSHVTDIGRCRHLHADAVHFFLLTKQNTTARRSGPLRLTIEFPPPPELPPKEIWAMQQAGE